MPHPDLTLARPPVFTCRATHGGLDAAWVNVVGELDITTAPELARTLRESQQLAHLTVLDLRELAFMDCAGVHTIVDATRRARQDGRRLIVVRGRPDVYRIFALTDTSGEVNIADLDAVQPAAPALQHSLVSQSLLRTGGSGRHRGPSH